MHKYMFLIFLSLGIQSHFVPLKIATSHSHRDIRGLVKEILSLLNKTHENFRETFMTPTNITCSKCSHKYTEEFIHELDKINYNNTTRMIEKQMKELENICPFLKKSPSNHLYCESRREHFDIFKKDLKMFVSWINEKNICNETQEMDKVNIF